MADERLFRSETDCFCTRRSLSLWLYAETWALGCWYDGPPVGRRMSLSAHPYRGLRARANRATAQDHHSQFRGPRPRRRRKASGRFGSCVALPTLSPCAMTNTDLSGAWKHFCATLSRPAIDRGYQRGRRGVQFTESLVNFQTSCSIFVRRRFSTRPERCLGHDRNAGSKGPAARGRWRCRRLGGEWNHAVVLFARGSAFNHHFPIKRRTCSG
jgi:hypothetical protein